MKKKTTHKQKSESITFRLTPEERKMIQELTKRLETTESWVVRRSMKVGLEKLKRVRVT